jgi:hypothetical protein
MIPARIANATRYLGAPPGWKPDENGPCAHLAIQDTLNGGLPAMISVWEPTPDELKRLNAGAKVSLIIMGLRPPGRLARCRHGNFGASVMTPVENSRWSAVFSGERFVCETCQGNGEIVIDWTPYRDPSPGDTGDEAVAECPDCAGSGRTPIVLHPNYAGDS